MDSNRVLMVAVLSSAASKPLLPATMAFATDASCCRFIGLRPPQFRPIWLPDLPSVYSLAVAASTTFSTVMPKWAKSSAPGADAPNPVIPTKPPFSPT